MRCVEPASHAGLSEVGGLLHQSPESERANEVAAHNTQRHQLPQSRFPELHADGDANLILRFA